MKKISLVAFCTINFLLSSKGQNTIFPSVTDPKKQIENLFEIKSDDLSHHFTIKINNGEYLVFELQKLSDWQGKEAFQGSLLAIVPVLVQYKDSFQNLMASKRLDIHIPEKEEPIISRFSQNMLNANLQSRLKNESSPLKMALDTLRFVKKFTPSSKKSEEDKFQFQYTFLLKDINNAGNIISDKQWCEQVATMIDSVVLHYRKAWHNQNSWHHHLYVTYSPQETHTTKRLSVSTRVAEDKGVKTQDMLSFNGGFGASLIRNTLCPNVDIGVQLNFLADRDSRLFARISLNHFVRFQEQSNSSFKAYGNQFIGGEFGIESNRWDPKSSFYSISFGLGYKLANKYEEESDPSISQNMYKMFFNYGINKTIYVTPEIYTDFKSRGSGWFGIAVNFRLF